MLKTNYGFRKLFIATMVALCAAEVAVADAPPPDRYRERIDTNERVTTQSYTGPSVMSSDEWRYRFSPGVTIWFFDEEDNELAPALYMDAWNEGTPLNYRVGVEFRHMDVEQDGSEALSDGLGRTPEITFVRIPFALEYYMPVGDSLTWYIGGGPDIFHTANDLGDTTLGVHVGTRIHYALNDRWGLSVEGGYMWGEQDGPAQDIDLSGAYLTPLITYTF